MSESSIISECYTDTILLTVVCPPQVRYNHKFGSPNVVRVMQYKLANLFAVGLVDEDKKKLDYLKEFELLADKNNLRLYRHPSRHHYMIQFSPPLEKWLMAAAQSVNREMSGFGLPNDLKDLRQITKTNVKQNDNQLVQSAIWKLNSSNPPSFVQLRNWVEYLKKETYHADTEVLKNL